MSPLGFLFDLLIALALPLLAFFVLGSRELSRAVVLFIALGLLSALAWARLSAPDVSLVEAAVGAGITGALIMSSLAARTLRMPPSASAARAWPLLLALLVAFALTASLALLITDQDPTGLLPEVQAALVSHDVTHPVTAVLLDFRGYDTLLEVFVLLVAALGVRQLQPTASRPSEPSQSEPLLHSLTSVLVPAFVLVAGYLVWSGSHAPGGAFQAAAVLAGGGALLLFARRLDPSWLDGRLARLFLLAGPVLYLVLAAAPLFFGASLLQYPAAQAGTLIFALELLLTLSIALMLILFFPMSSPAPIDAPPPEESAR